MSERCSTDKSAESLSFPAQHPGVIFAKSPQVCFNDQDDDHAGSGDRGGQGAPGWWWKGWLWKPSAVMVAQAALVKWWCSGSDLKGDPHTEKGEMRRND